MTTQHDTLTIARAIADTARKFGSRPCIAQDLLPFARCVEITLNNDRDVSDTIPAIKFCLDLKQPVCFAQLRIPHTEETIAYAASRCIQRKYHGTEAPFSQKIFHLAFSKINMWGEKFSGLGTPHMLAKDLLKTLSAADKQVIRKLPKQRLAFLGDSLMAALHWGAYGGYPDILAALFQITNPKVEVINAGIGGHTSWQGLERMDRDVLSKNPNTCFVAFGGNDLTRCRNGREPAGMARFRESMAEIVRRLKKNGVLPVFLNGARQYEFANRIYEKEVVEAINTLGHSSKVPVIDSYTLTWSGAKTDWLCFDDMHFNNSGQTQMARTVLTYLLAAPTAPRKNRK